jgi:O-antigen ligase
LVVAGVVSVLSPLLVVIFVCGVFYVVVSVRNLAAGLVLFTLLTFFESIPSLSSSGVTFSRLGGVVLAGAWILRLASRRPPPMLFRDHPFVAYVLIVLVGWAFASASWASDSGVALSDAFQYLQEMLLVFVVYSAIDTPRRLRWIIWAFIAGTTFSALIGLAGATPPDRTGLVPGSRLSGGIGDPNHLAALLVPAIVFAAFALAVVRAPLGRWVLVACTVICALALFRTESRGGILASGFVLVAAVLLSGPVRLRALVGISATAAFGLFYFTAVAPPQAFARITQFGADQGSGRIDIWNVAVQVVRNHPIRGVGAGNFTVVEPLYTVADINLRRTMLVLTERKVVHNTYLHVLTELGVVGLILFIAVIGAGFMMAMRAIRSFAASDGFEMEVLSRGLIIGTLGMLSAFLFFSAQHEKHLPLLIGILMALLSIARARTSRATRRGHDSFYVLSSTSTDGDLSPRLASSHTIPLG